MINFKIWLDARSINIIIGLYDELRTLSNISPWCHVAARCTTRYMHKNQLHEVLSNLSITLRILLTIPVTGERSFSRLKLIICGQLYDTRDRGLSDCPSCRLNTILLKRWVSLLCLRPLWMQKHEKLLFANYTSLLRLILCCIISFIMLTGIAAFLFKFNIDSSLKSIQIIAEASVSRLI